MPVEQPSSQQCKVYSLHHPAIRPTKPQFVQGQMMRIPNRPHFLDQAGATAGRWVALATGDATRDGALVGAVGRKVGPLVRGAVGAFVGASLIAFVGPFVGACMGAFVGTVVVVIVGGLAGAFVGAFVGAFAGDFVGAFIGAFVGPFVGGFTGALVGDFVATGQLFA
jgi:hypothetical protein